MRRAWIVILMIVLLILIGVGFLVTSPEMGQTLLEELDLAAPETQGYVASGILEEEIFHLANPNGGRVEALPVSAGQMVQAGEVVAVLDVSLLEAQRDAALARFEGARARLRMLEEGARATDLAVARAAVDLADAVWDGALLDLEDAQESVPVSLRDERVALAQAGVDRAQASREAAQAALQALREGASDAELDAGRAAVDGAIAELAGLEDQIAAQQIRAPVQGVVLEYLLLPGELALPGGPVVAIAVLGDLELTVYLPEAELGRARLGDPVEIRADAYPGRVFMGRLTHVAEEAEYTPRSVQTPEERVILVYAVRINVPNPGQSLKPGLSADVWFGGEP